MNNYSVVLVFFLVVCSMGNLIQTLVDDILDEQVRESKPFRSVFLWGEQKGMFPSYVHLNSHGKPFQTWFRSNFKIPDNNMFVTQFVIYSLLESVELGEISWEKIQVPLDLALDAFENHKDHNRESDNPTYCFWSQKLVNGTWVSFPENLVGLMETDHRFQDWLLEQSKKYRWSNVTSLLSIMKMFTSIFKIPADVDDSSVNLGLGGLLARTDPSGKTLKKWKKNNGDIGKFIRDLVKYAYRPFSDSENENVIDGRTYFWMRGFLHEQNKPIGLISTWMSNWKETRDSFYDAEGNCMPGNVNNVDANVVANALFGISSMLLTHDDVSWFNEDLKQLYLDSFELLDWILVNEVMTKRQDLVLLYYPSIYDFYWFVSRHISLLRNAESLPFPEMTLLFTRLEDTMQKQGTDSILKSIKQPNNEHCYWEEFLGNGDTSIFGKPKQYHEDRVFSTASALNSLLDTWTIRSSSKYSLLDDVPTEVVNAITCGSNWLKNTMKNKSSSLKLENTFFSGSIKTFESGIFSFPMNHIKFFNGTTISNCENSLVIKSFKDGMSMSGGVQGLIDEHQYEYMLSKKGCFGQPIPTEFHGFNYDDVHSPLPGWPYWSSPVLTKAFVLLSLVKSERLIQYT